MRRFVNGARRLEIASFVCGWGRGWGLTLRMGAPLGEITGCVPLRPLRSQGGARMGARMGAGVADGGAAAVESLASALRALAALARRSDPRGSAPSARIGGIFQGTVIRRIADPMLERRPRGSDPPAPAPPPRRNRLALVDPRAPAKVNFYGGYNRSEFHASHTPTDRASPRVAHQGFPLRIQPSANRY